MWKKHNQIILYQQLSSQYKTACVGWPSMPLLENLYGVFSIFVWQITTLNIY